MFKRLSLIALLVAGFAFGQSPQNNITAEVPTVSNLSIGLVGASGTTSYCYWVVAVYTGGKSAPYGPSCVVNSNGTLSSTNYNVVNFSVPSGTIVAPTGYDVLRTATATPPTGACACAVATAQSGTPVNDQSNTLNAYTVATLFGYSYQVLDVISNAVPSVKTYVYEGTTQASPVLVNDSLTGVQSVEASPTVAALATGVVLVPGVTGHTMKVLGTAILPVGGTVATCTDIRIEDSGFANDVFRFLVSGTLTAIIYDEASPAAQVTVGTGTAFGTAFGSGLGIGIQSTGSTCTTTTSLKVRVYYKVL